MVASGIPGGRWFEVQRTLIDCERAGLVKCSNDKMVFVDGETQQMGLLAEKLAAVARYLERTHQDRSTVAIAISAPLEPSFFKSALIGSGFGHSEFEDTDAAFVRLAATAVTRFVMVAPFLDQAGIEQVVRLCGHLSENVEPVLVFRQTARHDPTDLLRRNQSLLLRRNCQLREFAQQRIDGSRETFHSKVLLRDSDAAYVGSANFTAASRSYSLELGCLVEGFAAQRVATIVNCLLKGTQAFAYS
jgi:phosphatidylserine/phosphatidylglycerophosphate/cardiolipin synthase-like enzyme